jgi:hypothetical protein
VPQVVAPDLLDPLNGIDPSIARLRCFRMDYGLALRCVLDCGAINRQPLLRSVFAAGDRSRRRNNDSFGLRKGCQPLLYYGERLTPQQAALLLPLRVRPQDDLPLPDDLPPLLPSSNPIVREDVRDLIESLDPGAHQFIATSIIHDHTGQNLYAHARWYYFNNLRLLDFDAVLDTAGMWSDGSASEVERRLGDGRVIREIIFGHPWRSDVPLRYRADVITQYPFWRSYGVSLTDDMIFTVNIPDGYRQDLVDGLDRLPGWPRDYVRWTELESGAR